jgi:hypothetical protein
MIKFIKLYFGSLLISYSLLFWVIFLNVFTCGENIFDYFIEIITHLETLLIIPGIFIIYKSLHQK